MTFIQARHHGGNSNTPITRLVIHATCPDVGYPSASRAGRAASTANYFATTDRPASAHYVCDIATTVQCLSEEVIGFHAPPNSHSIGIEICADGGSHASFEKASHAYTREQWLSDDVWPAVERAAILARGICHRHHIPVRKLSTAQVKSGMSGICGHDNVSDAFHQSDHDDPGPHFPWNEFIAAVQGKTTNKGELSMSDVNTLTKLIKASNDQLHYDIGVVQTQNGTLKSKIDNLSWVKNPVTGKKWSTKDALWSVWYYILECRNRIMTLENRISDLEKKVK
ncbi:N-acetylmuramoyl-L-alanine amidase [Cutibacterium avidum]|nr:peptidoglycan recognition family protein [Cutibacterium avidum]QQY15078.1 N-acetylmuramoyl-L-alanine amidase [Cutibacterium avidum]